MIVFLLIEKCSWMCTIYLLQSVFTFCTVQTVRDSNATGKLGIGIEITDPSFTISSTKTENQHSKCVR